MTSNTDMISSKLFVLVNVIYFSGPTAFCERYTQHIDPHVKSHIQLPFVTDSSLRKKRVTPFCPLHPPTKRSE